MITFTVGTATVQIDDIDADLAELTWYINSDGYVVRNTERHHGRRIKVRLHRIIMRRVLGRELERWELVDHTDRDVLNNCRSNLRLCNNSENQFNRDLPGHNKTGFKGVSWNTHRAGPRPYQACITVGRRKVYLGSYADARDAARAYDEAARHYAGVFARGNYERTDYC